MIAFGPWVRYPDPRVYDLIARYGWGPHQREMLLGVRPWPATAQPNVMSIVSCLRERGIRVGLTREGVAHVRMDGLPPPDPLLPDLLAQWRVEIPRVSVLALEGPVEVVGGVPVLRGTVFGRCERADGRRHDSLHHGAWVVGRGDVLRTWRRDDGVEPWWDRSGEPVLGADGVRGTLRRAVNTARAVARAIPEWEAWRAWKARRDGEAGAARVAAEDAQEVDDEGVVGFVA